MRQGYKVAIGILIILLLGLIWWFGFRYVTDKDFPSTIENRVEEQERKTWARYRNEQFKFELQYPDNLRPRYERGPGNSATIYFAVPEESEEVESVGEDGNGFTEGLVADEEPYWFVVEVTADEPRRRISNDLVADYLSDVERSDLTRTMVGEKRVRATAFQAGEGDEKVRQVWFKSGGVLYRFRAPFSEDVLSSRTLSTLKILD